MIELSPSPIVLEDMVVTATISERAAAEALRPVSVMTGDVLQRQMTATVAGTLASMPGLASTGMGPSVAQPVIRGLSGDRVLMLEDGTVVGDASNQGADHTTALDLALGREVVGRGSPVGSGRQPPQDTTEIDCPAAARSGTPERSGASPSSPWINPREHRERLSAALARRLERRIAALFVRKATKSGVLRM